MVLGLNFPAFLSCIFAISRSRAAPLRGYKLRAGRLVRDQVKGFLFFGSFLCTLKGHKGKQRKGTDKTAKPA